MAKHIVKCRVCKEKFDAQIEDENTLWVMPSRNFYYHKDCYEKWKQDKEGNETNWVELIYDFIARDIKGKYNWHQIEKQRIKFLNEGMTNKGIYFALYWYFLLKKHTWIEKYGIGIVPSIYKQSTAYWVDKNKKSNAVMEQIEQLATQRLQDKIVIKERKSKKKFKAVKPD